MTTKPDDTPEDHVIVGLSIEPGLLPEWFEEVQAVATAHCIRMGVRDDPDDWLVKVELPRDRVPAFSAELEARWEDFVARRRAEGRWEAAEE